MAQIIWTEPALQNLNDTAEFIALGKITAANNLVQKLFSSTECLEESPKSDRKPSGLENSRYLELIVNPCRIVYRVEKDKVYILYVMRSERTLRNFLLDDRGNQSS